MKERDDPMRQPGEFFTVKKKETSSMTDRKPFRLTPEQKLEQMRILVAAQSFAIPVLTREKAIGLIATDEAKLDLKARRIVVAYDIGDSLGEKT